MIARLKCIKNKNNEVLQWATSDTSLKNQSLKTMWQLLSANIFQTCPKTVRVLALSATSVEANGQFESSVDVWEAVEGHLQPEKKTNRRRRRIVPVTRFWFLCSVGQPSSLDELRWFTRSNRWFNLTTPLSTAGCTILVSIIGRSRHTQTQRHDASK